jgi:hypothetical protein
MILENQCIPSRYAGNGYGQFLDIDPNDPESRKPVKASSAFKLKIRVSKVPKEVEDSEDDDPEDPDKNRKKKMIFICLVYVATLSFIALEYFLFCKTN